MNTVNAFFDLPLYGQLIVGFILLFFFFIIAIEIKFFCERLKKKGGIYKVLAYLIIIPFGLAFLVADAGFNIFYLPFIYGERANKYDEGWLVTSRLQYHKAQHGWYWQRRVSLFICDKFVDRVDPGHCSTSRWS